MTKPLIDFLRLFKFISAEDEELISASFKDQKFKEGDELFSAGNICRKMFFICNGVLKIIVENEKGNYVTHYFLKENCFCTILNSFTNEVVAKESIQAACHAEVLMISKTELLLLYEKLPYLKTLINQITQQALLNKIQIRNTYLGQDSTTRYRLFLMRQPEVALRVSLIDIASYLGITPQSLSRIRKNMR